VHAHELVLALVDLEPAVGGERGVEEAERVGEADLLQDLDLVPAPDADRRRRPFARAVDGQDRRVLEGRRVEARGRVADVVLGEEELRGGDPSFFDIIDLIQSLSEIQRCIDSRKTAAERGNVPIAVSSIRSSLTKGFS
jgi:hypothetical protein